MRDPCTLGRLTSPLEGAMQDDFGELSEVDLERSLRISHRDPRRCLHAIHIPAQESRTGYRTSHYVREAGAPLARPALQPGFEISKQDIVFSQRATLTTHLREMLEMRKLKNARENGRPNATESTRKFSPGAETGGLTDCRLSE